MRCLGAGCGDGSTQGWSGGVYRVGIVVGTRGVYGVQGQAYQCLGPLLARPDTVWVLSWPGLTGTRVTLGRPYRYYGYLGPGLTLNRSLARPASVLGSSWPGLDIRMEILSNLAKVVETGIRQNSRTSSKHEINQKT